jgi:autotransporter-associated beta strand protein
MVIDKVKYLSSSFFIENRRFQRRSSMRRHSRSLLSLTGSVAVLGLVLGGGSPVVAQYLVTSFETQSDLFTPLNNPPPVGTPTVALSSQYGVTQGTNSMEVVPTGYTWEWLTKDFGPETYAQWYNHQTLAFDFTRVTTTAGNYELVASISAPTTGPSGWNEKQLVNWAWQNGGLNQTQTITWDYSAILATSPLPGSGTAADFWNLGFVARTNPDYAPQYGYIDNIRFINPVTPTPYVWAGNGSAEGGSGYWSTVFQDATWLANGQQPGVEWDSYKKALFKSTGGVVTVSGTVVARNGMQFDTAGYTVVSDTAANYRGKIDMAGGTPTANAVTVASGVSAGVDLPLVGSNGFSKAGAGTLVLGGVSTITGTALISDGKLVDPAGTALSDATIVVAPGGTYEAPAGVAVSSDRLRLAGGTLAVTKLNVTTGLNPGYVVNGFETQEELYDPTASMTNIVLSTTAGVTSGSAAMGMTWTQGSDYTWTFKGYDPEDYAAWKANKKIAVDVTQVNSGTGGGNIAANMSFNGDMGWNQTGNSTYPRFINYSWVAAGGSTTTTYYWDYSEISAGASGTSEFFQINLAGALGGAWGDQQVYFDNMRFVDPVVPDAVGIANFVVESGTIAGAPDLAVFNGGRMTLPSNRPMTISVATLSVTEAGTEPAGGGKIDLGAGRVVIASGGISASDLVLDILAGRGDGSWNGATGITSSLAAADVAASIPRAVGWMGGGGGMTVAYAALGDTNLDWQVDILDSANILTAGKFNTGVSATWFEGDFNYDGLVNVLDVADFITTGLYNQGSYNSPPASVGAVAAVPEPAMPTVVLGVSLLAGLGMRRRWLR